MEKLEDYIKGYPHVMVLLLVKAKKDSDNYYLVKEEGHNTYYFLKNTEVLDREYIVGDHLEKLTIKYLNNKDVELVKQIEDQLSYKWFIKMIKQEIGSNYEDICKIIF